MTNTKNKYQELIQAATIAGVSKLSVKEENGVLSIEGEAPHTEIRNMLWATYEKLDPGYRSGDLVMNISVAGEAAFTKAKVTTSVSNLNIRRKPGTDQEIIGKAAHDEIVEIIDRQNELWWLIRTMDGEEGYAYAQYLTPVEG